ncbi:hypothetical protein [Butyrivibrio sp. INlla16]|uniref:hypothetical protein n=1 Tax=Butyrivibrio sp. INlla16 TaxID=1520807 RepID=UPI000884C712|nr:hypothetical protein [Butyrivibrio sp. INlla16]SDB13848.1 hypothetical protein SAMN02910263_00640 [Butyrivibrio sp. INlla16]
MLKVIEEGIQNNDVDSLRDALGNLVYTSSDFSSGEFEESLRYIESKGIAIKDNHLTGPDLISKIKTEFTDDDLADSVYELKKNFCDERIEDVKAIGKALNAKKDEIKKFVPQDSSSDVRLGDDPNLSSHPQRSNTALIIICAVAVVMIVLLVIWMF